MYNITILSKRSYNRLFHRIWVFCFDIKPHTLNVAQCPKSRTRFESEGLSHHKLPKSSQQLFCYSPTTDESNISNSN